MPLFELFVTANELTPGLAALAERPTPRDRQERLSSWRVQARTLRAVQRRRPRNPHYRRLERRSCLPGGIMYRRLNVSAVLYAALLSVFVLSSTVSEAADTLSFSAVAGGTNRSVSEWGLDTAWASSSNMRLSLVNFGSSKCDVVRLNFNEDQPLLDDGTLNAAAKTSIDAAVVIAKQAGANVPISLTPDTGAGTNAYYLDANGAVIVDRYVAVIKATAKYLKDQYGLTISGVEVLNEPDYWTGQPTAAQANTINTTLKGDPLFASASIIGPSTLSPNQSWYNNMSGTVNYGSTHKLGGSATDYKNFINNVTANGDKFYNPEIHSMAELTMGAHYGMSGGIFWGPAMNARGKFVQASDGREVGYAENLSKETAAAVYRGTDGKLSVFAGGFERQGTTTYYRAVCTDRLVYFNGVGPISQYMVKAAMSDQGSYVDVRYGSDAIGLGSALDGNEWKIINRQTGQVLQVSNGSTASGGVVNTANYTGSTSQYWNVTRSNDGYYALFNANSGITMEVYNSSLAEGGRVDQRGTASSYTQQWTVESAGNGYFRIANGNSGKYLTGSGTQAYQSSLSSSYLQQWQFIRVNQSTGTLKAQYKFEGNVLDSVGTSHATANGSVTYGTGIAAAATGASGVGQALNFDGSTSYAQLPSGAASSKDITISTWVRWNGGANWQRIFDFGSGTTSYMFLSPKSGDGTMRFAITSSGGTSEEILDADVLATNQWVNVAVTLDGNTGILYVNGKAAVAGRIVTNPSDISATLNYVGKSQFSSDPLFSGMIDDLRIYDYALSATEMSKVGLASHYVWTGAGGSEWSTASLTTKNWQLSFNNAATDYFNGDTILFDDTANNFIVTPTTNVSPISTVFNNTVTYTLSGTAGIAGSGTLTKDGSGTLNINGKNTYLGSTSLNGGVVNLNGSLGGTIITVNAAIFNESSSGSISGGVAFTNLGITSLAGTNVFGAFHASGPGSVSISGGKTTTSLFGVGDSAGDSASCTISNAVLNSVYASRTSVFIGSGEMASGTLAITSAEVTSTGDVWIASAAGARGNLTISGNSQAPGSMIVSGIGGVYVSRNPGATGTLSLNSYGYLTAVAVTGGTGTSTLNFNGGTLNATSSGTAFVQGFTRAYVQAGGAVINTNDFNVTVSQSFQHDPALTPADGGLTKQGSGVLTLTGSSFFTGAVVVNAGFIKAAALTNLGGGTAVALNGGGLIFAAAFDPTARTFAVNAGGGTLDTNGNAVALAGNILGGGNLTKIGSGTLTLAGTANVGGVSVKAGTLALASTESNDATLDVTNDSEAVVSITGGTHTLRSIVGSGTTTVAGSAVLTVACLVQDALILGGTGESEAAEDAASTVSTQNVATEAVPEPSTFALLLGCLIALGAYCSRRRAK